jgi:glutathione S-transferase
VAFEIVPVIFQNKEHKSETFLALNPNGKVPTLVDGEFVLWESMAIDLYIARKYKPELLGSSVEDMAKIDQWSYWTAIHLQNYIEIVMFFSMFQRGAVEGVEQAKQDIVPYLNVLNLSLEGKEFLVGNMFTIADIHVGSALNLAVNFGFDLALYPNILRYHEALKARPANQKLQG